jgi:hypothetical protein
MPLDNKGWRPYVSYNIELSTVLNFAKHDPRQKESSQFSHAVVIGLRHTNWQFALGFNIAD